MGAPNATSENAQRRAYSWPEDYVPPEVELDAFTPAEIWELFRDGEVLGDECEEGVVWAARARGAVDVALAEGLALLEKGSRQEALGFHVDDFAREVLDLGEYATRDLLRLGRELPTRPLLREALRSGKVYLTAALTVLRVAKGEAEGEWVRRASRMTVRELRAEIARAGAAPEEDDDWQVFDAQLTKDERTVVEGALDLAARVIPGASRMEALEAIAQEFLGEHPWDPDAPEPRLGPRFRPVGPSEDERRAKLERETERFGLLERLGGLPAPEVRFYETALPKELAAQLRELAKVRNGWDEIIGCCCHALRKARFHERHGFASFRHYAEERLGLPARAVEQRASFQERLAASPALREAKRQKVSYERLRLLARLPEGEIASWVPRAHALTVVELRRKLTREKERQMNVRNRLGVAMPRRIAVVLAAAIETVKARTQKVVSTGEALAFVAVNFMETWDEAVPAQTRSQRIRERDGHVCQVPGCSRKAAHAHHVTFKSHAGDPNDPANQVALCAFHHLRCIHGGYMEVFGEAPDELEWYVDGERFTGGVTAPAGEPVH